MIKKLNKNDMLEILRKAEECLYRSWLYKCVCMCVCVRGRPIVMSLLLTSQAPKTNPTSSLPPNPPQYTCRCHAHIHTYAHGGETYIHNYT